MTFSVRLIGPAALCLGLAIPAVASACDMKAVSDELARESLAPQLQAAADPSGSATADPSGSEQQPPEGAKAQSSGAQQGQSAAAASKTAAPMGHSGTAEQTETK